MAGQGAASIKGNVLMARAQYVRTKAGDLAWRKVTERLSPADRRVLAGTLLPMTWYDFGLASRLDAAIAAELSPADPQRVFIDMGRASAEVNLAGAERVFLRPGDPQHVLKMAPQIYGFYYQVGRRTYERISANAGVVRTFDAESVTAADCLTVMGWHQRALELSGASEVVAEHPLCRAAGGDHCAYAFRWSTARPPSKAS